MAYRIVESVHGTWLYHLTNDRSERALCGAQTMATGIPLSAWGRRSHLNERYCKDCEANRDASAAVARAKEPTR